MASHPTLVLASGSAIRQHILRQADIDFRVCVSNIDEAEIKTKFLHNHDDNSHGDITELPKRLAIAKAKAVSVNATDIVIGADQIMEMDGTVFDKPASIGEAQDRLLSMRGRVHHLIGSVALVVDGETIWSHTSQTSLKMRMFSKAFLADYIAQEGEELLHSVGGYKFEQRGAHLFDWVKGDFFSILGLPLLPLLAQLRTMKVLEK
ncbi:MAG TPA: Maf-like protein [Hellea balneolensis]|uniref:Nucleoside triphosphate pyrophosphatase n=1 Tax=Hellea balneolensis TaxID=287478 RepID=A0A7C5M1N1_9PROT|nr:Maf-like protein [Hellea balneolensis]